MVANKPYIQIGKRLKWLRENMGLSQSSAIEKLGILATTYQKYEQGISKPNTSKRQNIIDFYGCSVGWLLAGEGVPYPDRPDVRPPDEQATESEQPSASLAPETVVPQKDLPPGTFDRFMDEIKRSRELDHTISELIVSKRQGGFDEVLFKTIHDAIREFLNKNGRHDLCSRDFGFANVIHVIYRELKKTPQKEELMSLIAALHALGRVFPCGVPLTSHEQNELFSWGRLPAPEDNIKAGE
jgi:transcriptional regulator with XRE-family HTH domain